MIADDERRNVAAKMREICHENPDVSLQGMVASAMNECLPEGMEYGPTLADLIDIPTCVMTNVGGDFENSFQCSNCMNEFDMPDYDRYPYKRCPECGAVVVDAD